MVDSLDYSRSRGDPFADDLPVFFAGGSRQAMLDTIVQICQFENSLIAVVGSLGVGKTTLIHQIPQHFDSASTYCLVTASATVTTTDILQQIASQLGMVTTEASIGKRIAEIKHHIIDKKLHHVLVVIDDAHHLNEQTLAVLMSLLQRQQTHHLHLLLAGNQTLTAHLDMLETSHTPIYELALESLTLEACSEYISFRLSSVGYNSQLFNRQIVNGIWSRSQGVPAKINRAASEYLLSEITLNKPIADEAVEPQKPSKLTIMSMAFGFTVLAGLAMLWVFRGNDTVVDQTVTDQVAMAPNVAPVDGRNTNRSAIVKAPVEEPPIDSKLTPDQPTQQSVIATQGVMQTDKNMSDSTDQSPLGDNANTVNRDIIKPSAKTLPDKVKQALADERKTINDLPEIASPTVKNPVTKVAVKPKKPQLAKDEQTVMSWRSSDYSLQVMAMASATSIKQFMGRQPNRESLYLISLKKQGDPWHVLLAGPYDSKDNARSAIKSLPSEQIKAGPWAVQVSDIQQKITEVQ